MPPSDETEPANLQSADLTEVLPRIDAPTVDALPAEDPSPSAEAAETPDSSHRAIAFGRDVLSFSHEVLAVSRDMVLAVVRRPTRRGKHVLAIAGSALTVMAITFSAVSLSGGTTPTAAFLPAAGPSADATPQPMVSPSVTATRSPGAHKPGGSSPVQAGKLVGGESVGRPGAPVNLPSPTGAPRRQPVTLEDYLALVPTFAAAPTPVKVSLSHAAGEAAFTSRIPTSKPVAFITIDDGWHKDQLTHDLLQRAGIPVTAFLTTGAVQSDVDFFGSLRASGMAIENHTMTHPCFALDDSTSNPCDADMTYDEQVAELCGASDELESWYGNRPTLFRPPYLQMTGDTLRAGWDCGLVGGMSAEQSVHNGVISWVETDHRVHAGDIMVMHFDASFPDDFIAALEAIKASGLTPALLEDYVTVS